LVSKLLKEDAEAASGAAAGKARKRPTLGAQFKTSLEGLMQALYRCEPHFVRCMKSNHVKKGNVFESEMMMAQLRYAGLLEVCRIRKVGFPVRKKFDDFLFRYRCLDLHATKDHRTLCAALEAKGILKPRQWVIGHTKVFMKNLQQQELEDAREKSLMGVVRKMQACARRFICRCRYLKYKQILKTLREAIGKRTEEALDAALSEAPELPFNGWHVKEVKEARALKERLEEERRITAMCQEAIRNRDLAELKNACKAADDAVFDNSVVAEARALRDLMEKEKAAVKKLRDAIDARSMEAIDAAISGAKPFGSFVVDTDTYRQAVALKERMLQEAACRDALSKAIKARDFAALTAALNQASEMALNEDIVSQAQSLRAELEEHENALNDLREATKERVLTSVQSALKRCQKVKLPESHPEYVAGKALEARLLEEKDTEDELNAAADTKDLARIEKAVAKATKMGMNDSSPGLRKANKALERLKAEAGALQSLKDAVKANKATAIMGALNRCNELGLEGKEIDSAKEALGKLGAQSEALLRLSDAVNNGDIDGVDKELATLEKMGLGKEPEVEKAREDKKRIVKQNKCAESLKAAMDKGEIDPLTAALHEADELNLRVGRHEDLYNKATALADKLGKTSSYAKAFKKLVEADDEEGLKEAIAKADSDGAGPEVAAKGDEALKALEARKEFIKRLTEAMDAEPKDKELLGALVEEAANLGIKGTKIDMANNFLNRDKAQKEVKKALKKAMKGTDEKALADAIEKAIQIGMGDSEDVAKAKEQKQRLEEEKELAADVRAAMKALTVKAESKNGVTPADLEPLDKAIAEAKAKGLSDDSPFMQEATAARERINNVLALQQDIARVIDGDNLRAMKKVLDRAEDMDLGNSSQVKKLRARVREVERARSAAALADDSVDESTPSLDDEEMKRQREEKMKKASNAKFEWDKYPKIRNGDDFAKGILLQKKKVKQMQLRWQNTVINTSILDYINKDLAKLATRVHKCILGYTGDKSMSFPATLAQDILQKGLECPDLVDEIYVQLCKHLTMNPKPESAVRAWQLMCMCVGTFPPSRDFENHLINFILKHKDGAGAVGNYARYSLRRLEGILNSGPSGFVPSVEEIQAYKERPPILATIELVDGTPLTEDLPITPDLNVAKVLDICYHFLELSDPRMQYFGIFVEDVEDPSAPPIDASSDDAPPYAGLPKTPRPLQNENFMGDVVTVKVRQNQPFKFVFKRKIFLKNLDGPSEDPMFERLTYLQAVDEVVNGNIPLDSEEDVIRLTTQAMVVDLMDNFPETADELVESDLMEYVPKSWRDNRKPEAWGEKVLKHYKKYKDPEDKRGYQELEAEEIQTRFVDAVRDHPL
jgi:Myosin head (motor domain)/MyTH4 domain